ncbi:MAG: glutamate synthase large subunit, partial [Deltaproteobacteria bacterium]|nr:glutamate synthase large subunit [Deltaproteobacteria bacterium]
MLKATKLEAPGYEHDACGVGFVARIDGRADHSLVDDAISALARMAHRGGAGHDPNQADGAGLLMPIPRLFVQRVWGALCAMPERYGLGHFFLPQDEKHRERAEEIVESSLRANGLYPLAWRDTPLRTDALPPAGLESLPVIRQLLVDLSTCPPESSEGEMERRLYMARRQMETSIAKAMAFPRRDFHVASLSCRSVVYKGMLPGSQLAALYPDLADRDFMVHFAIFHERYSTNTTPAWRLAQPFRCLAHNGEINTIRSNQMAMRMRESLLASPLFNGGMEHMLPVLDETGSDSAMLDNAMELLVHGGRSLPHAAMMLIPEPFGKNFIMGDDKRAFYEYHAALMEPWDGPAALVFTDGHRQIGAVLDRNALRPSRYCVTKDGKFLLASEAGVLDIPAAQIAKRGRLQPRRMLLVDFARHRVVTDAECKGRVIYGKPYRHWMRRHGIQMSDLPQPPRGHEKDHAPLPMDRALQLFGYAAEDLADIITPMAKDAQEPVASMGDDTPLAVLSNRPQLLFRFFKQRFAQVTNPPIDPLREELVMSLKGFLGKRRNLLEETPEHYAQLRLPHPLLLADDLARLRVSEHPDVKTVEIPMLFARPSSPEERHAGGDALEKGLNVLFAAADKALKNGATILILSDRKADAHSVPIPSLLAVSGLHQHLMRKKTRHACGIVVDTGEAREVMHIAQLLAFGAGAVHPRVAMDVVAELAREGKLGEVTERIAKDAYVTAAKKGLLKTFARMGISTIRSFCGGQGFEALGLGQDVVQEYFTGIASRLDGIGLDHIAKDALARHAAAFPEPAEVEPVKDGGTHRHRKDGERHLWSPESIRALHKAVRENDYAAYKEYAACSDDQGDAPVTLRSLFTFAETTPVPLDEVEPEERIMPRFVGAAMSFGSISKEAHEAVAVAMNRVGAKSNCGEGGEDPERAVLLPDGSDRRSHIRQLASGRFGVTATYLVQADEIQIKIAQGAKPGEGGQLPAHKVLPEIARVRRTIPGVTLISPPPHHDIYSIEDLAQLIFDLKCLHPKTRISVKLVAGVGVGTIATGVAKAGADTIIISGHDGGTGASPRTAIRHVGMPWELGLAETQTALVQSGMRDRLTVQTDGQLRTGRDIAIAALMGAEEFALGTCLLVSLGCCLLRVCHKGTCAVGIATQDEKLRAKFAGNPDHVERFLRFLARDLREHMARLGFRTVDEMIGKSGGVLRAAPTKLGSKVSLLNLAPLIAGTAGAQRRSAPFVERNDSPLDAAMLSTLMPGILAGQPTRFEGMVRNTDRAVGTRIAGEIARMNGDAGLTPGSVEILLNGTAGQSAGAFLTRGVT